MSLRRFLFAVGMSVTALAAGNPFPPMNRAGAAERVIVHTRDGRILSGEIDARTGADDLWLRLSEPSILLLSPVAWRDVESAELQGRQITRDELQKATATLKTEIPKGIFGQPSAPAAPSLPVDPAMPALRVQSLAIDATIANWDSDAEVDGLEVRVYPQAADGSAVPINGQIVVRLFGQRFSYIEIREDVTEIGKWTERLRPRQFTAADGSAVIRLPFRVLHPEFDLDVRWFGQVNATLNVAGQGVYDASVPVVLRSFSPLRDYLHLYRGERFFPGERAGRYYGHLPDGTPR